MTLLMTIVRPEGVWMCTDHRLTEHPSRQLITDLSVKHVAITAPDGAALVAYTGLGRYGRIDLSQWIREILRGESRSLMETFNDLADQATDRFGLQLLRLGVPHVFVAATYSGGYRHLVEIRNFPFTAARGQGAVQPNFSVTAIEATAPMVGAAGGGRNAISKKDFERLRQVSQHKPRQPSEFSQLLGDVNQRAASSGRPGSSEMSPSCTVVYMPAAGHPIQTAQYGAPTPRSVSHVMSGIDIGEFYNAMVANVDEVWDGRMTEAEFGALLERAGRRAVDPRGRRRP